MFKRFSGVVVPMATPFHDDLTVDVESAAKIIRLFARHNIDPLVLGTTGESSSIDEKESIRLVEAAVNARSEGQLIYAGIVCNQVQEIIRRGNSCVDAGADAVVVTLPSYYILTPGQMESFYKKIADEISGPLFMYNIKATTQMSIPADVIARLSKHPNIYGLKDSERDEIRMKLLIETYKDREDFSYFCGWGAQSAGSLQLGADGIVPSTGNIVPELYGKLYEAAMKQDWNNCFDHQRQTDEIALLYQKDRTLGESLAKLKQLMYEKGLCGTTMMPPLLTTNY